MGPLITVSSELSAKVQHIDKVIKTVGDRDTALLNLFLDHGKQLTQTRYEWANRALPAFKTRMAATLSSTAVTNITLSAGTSIGTLAVVQGTTILDIADEYMRVLTVVTVTTNSTVLNVARAVLGTTTASTTAIVPNTQVLVAQEGQVEGFDVSRDDSQLSQLAFNYTMILEKQVRLSGTAQAIETLRGNNGMELSLREQTGLKLKELLKLLQHSVVHSRRLESSGTSTAGSFGGLRWWAQQVGNDQDAAGGALTLKLVDDTIQNYIDRGGNPSKIMLIVPVTQQRKFNELKVARVNAAQPQGDMTINNFVERYAFGSNAQVDVIWCTDLKDNEVFFCQKDKISVNPLSGRMFGMKEIAKSGDSDKRLLVGEYGMIVENPRETLYRITNLSTSLT